MISDERLKAIVEDKALRSGLYTDELWEMAQELLQLRQQKQLLIKTLLNVEELDHCVFDDSATFTEDKILAEEIYNHELREDWRKEAENETLDEMLDKVTDENKHELEE